MKKKPTVINSFEQLNKVLNTEIKYEPVSEKYYDGTELKYTAIDTADWRGMSETKRVSLLAKSKRRY